jgi:hypothetical protein
MRHLVHDLQQFRLLCLCFVDSAISIEDLAFALWNLIFVNAAITADPIGDIVQGRDCAYSVVLQTCNLGSWRPDTMNEVPRDSKIHGCLAHEKILLLNSMR